MEKSKVIELLKCIKTNEIGDFRKMLISPFFTRKEVVKSLFECLIKFHPNFEDSKKLNKAVVYKKVFKEKVPSDERLIIKKLKNPSYDLKNLLEEFFILQELKNQSLKKRYLLLSRFSNQNNDDLALRELELIEKDITKMPFGDESFYQNYKLYSTQHLYRNILKHSSKKLNQMLESLNDLKDLQFLKFGLEALIKNQLFDDEDVSFKLSDFKTIAKKNEHSNSLLLLIYSRLFLLNTEEKEESYYIETTTVFFQSKRFLKYEKQIISIFFINYCNKKVAEGKNIYYRKAFDIYKTCFDEQIFINEDGSIHPTHFRNVVMGGCELKEFLWVENFIAINGNKVKKSKKDNLIIFSNVLLSFYKGNFESALEKSRDVKFNDIYDKITVKNLVLRCYFELSEFSLLDYFASAYKKFLHTNPLIGELRKKRVLNFITITQNLANNKATGKPSKKELENHLSKLCPVAHHEWLVQKIELL